jgi:steroid delta-isomerase-like uncharacterized protein
MSQLIHKIADDLLDAWNEHDIPRILSYYAADCESVDVSQALPQRGIEGLEKLATRYFQAFPDLHFTRETVITDGNQMAVSWTARGTHEGRLMEIPPTRKTIHVSGVSMMTVQDGKITFSKQIWDVAGLLRSIGLLPDL